ncbi:hypothetical protein HDE_14399 [Halotydeus destructor]|nr:hypothetical protein HDE_14399 [Halotydeus destructor]
MNYCNMFQCYSGQVLRDKQAIRAKRAGQLVRLVAQRNAGLVTDSTEDAPCHLTGEVGPYLWYVPRDMGYNCTAATDVQGQMGPDGNYTGYTGQLQRGTADFGMVFTQMPFPGDPVDYSTVFSAEKISFATMYKRPHRPQGPADLMASILQVDLPSMCVFLAFLAIFVKLLKIWRQKSSVFHVVQNLFQYVGIPGETFSLRWLGLTLITFIFMVNQYYSNVILVDLVRQEHPKVLKHFFDILDPKVDLYVGRNFLVRDILRNSRNLRVQLLADKIDKLTLNKTMVGEGVDEYDIFVGPPRDRLFGSLSGQDLLKHTKIVTCSVMKYKDGDPTVKQSLWIPQDSPYEFLTTAAYSKTLDKGIKQVLDLAMLRGFEHQVYTDILRSRVALKIKELILPEVVPDPLCYSDTILFEEASESDDITINNVFWITLLSIFLCALASVALVLEIRFIRSTKRKTKAYVVSSNAWFSSSR